MPSSEEDPIKFEKFKNIIMQTNHNNFIENFTSNQKQKYSN